MGGWWRWALHSPDGVAPSRMVGVFASVNLPLHHKVQKFSSVTGSLRWSRKKGHKTVVVWWCGDRNLLLSRPYSKERFGLHSCDRWRARAYIWGPGWSPERGPGTKYVTSHPGQLSLAIPPWVGHNEYWWWSRPPLWKEQRVLCNSRSFDLDCWHIEVGSNNLAGSKNCKWGWVSLQRSLLMMMKTYGLLMRYSLKASVLVILVCFLYTC